MDGWKMCGHHQYIVHSINSGHRIERGGNHMPMFFQSRISGLGPNGTFGKPSPRNRYPMQKPLAQAIQLIRGFSIRPSKPRLLAV